jgi:phospholipid transport system substrate-binding protein
MNMRNRILALTAVGALVFGGGAAATAAGPDEVIREASSEIVAVLDTRRDELAADEQELYRVVDNILLPRFDRRYAGGLVMGKYWREATEEQRERFIMALYRSLLRTYAGSILDYEADSLEVLPFEGDLSEGKAVVETRVTLDTGVVTPVNYRMRLTDDSWKAYDVIIEGISYVTNYRKQYASEFRAKGVEQVIAELEAKGAEPPPKAAAE